jgi:hypothetical protein
LVLPTSVLCLKPVGTLQECLVSRMDLDEMPLFWPVGSARTGSRSDGTTFSLLRVRSEFCSSFHKFRYLIPANGLSKWSGPIFGTTSLSPLSQITPILSNQFETQRNVPKKHRQCSHNLDIIIQFLQQCSDFSKLPSQKIQKYNTDRYNGRPGCRIFRPGTEM